MIRRPVVPVAVNESAVRLQGVIDSGSPISAANAALFTGMGVDIDTDEPLYDLGLTIGGLSARAPVFEVTLWLYPSSGADAPRSWRLLLLARRSWTFPFAVLLGQRGWFDQFPTRIDATTSVVEV